MIPDPENEESRREIGLDRPERAEGRIRHAWRLTTRYFVSEDWKAAWALLICYIFLQFGPIYVLVVRNGWQRRFYDAIEQRHGRLFLPLVGLFAIILAAQVAFNQLNTLVSWTLSIRWRNWMTDRYLGRWFARDRFYEIERIRLIDNPDQRISDDINGFTSVSGITYVPSIEMVQSPITVAVGIVSSLVTAVTFAAIILSVSRPIRFALFGRQFAFGGDLVWYSIAYCLFGTAMIAWIGKPYVRRRMRQQHLEGNFRSGLVHVRRNSEQIAFAGTQKLEWKGLGQAFANIRLNWFVLMWSNIGLNIGVGAYQRLTSIVPFLVTVPRFFARQITFGQVMAIQDAFVNFSGALSYLVEAYPGIANQVANVNRLKALDDSLDYSRSRGIAFVGGGTPVGVAIENCGLRISRPHGEHLVDVGEWTIREGDRWVIEGPSGAGKTTLLRAIAGLWPDGEGQVRMSRRNTAMLVPQRLYIPLGTLKNAVCFPDPDSAYDDAAIAALLHRVHLGAHINDLHEVRYWQEELSPGEQQRIALARILLHRPELLIIDEATSALDPANATHFYQSIVSAIPGVTLISVIHNEELAQFHTKRLRITGGVARQELVAKAA